jgi:hypothetical protein
MASDFCGRREAAVTKLNLSRNGFVNEAKSPLIGMLWRGFRCRQGLQLPAL